MTFFVDIFKKKPFTNPAMWVSYHLILKISTAENKNKLDWNKIEKCQFVVLILCRCYFTCTVSIYFVEQLACHWFGAVLPGAEQASMYST